MPEELESVGIRERAFGGGGEGGEHHMGIIEGIEKMPTEGKLMLAGGVVAVAVIGYVAFKKGSSGSSSSSSTSTPPMTGVSTTNGPEDVNIVVTDKDGNRHYIPTSPGPVSTPNGTLPPGANWGPNAPARMPPGYLGPPLKPPTKPKGPPPAQRPPHQTPPGANSGPNAPAQKPDPDTDPDHDRGKGGAYRSYIPIPRVAHPLHSAVIGSKRSSMKVGY